MENIRPNAERAKIAIILIWIVLVIEIVSLISDYFQYDLLQTAANGEEVSIARATANDVRQQAIAIIFLIVYTISGVTFIQWFRRAYFNLHLKINDLSNSEGWAAGSWFVPFVNLYLPFQIMKELYIKTWGLLTSKGLPVKENFTTTLLVWWWTLWIINGIMGQFVFRYSMKAKTIDELTTSTIVGMISSIIGIPLALITIKVIKDYAGIEPVLNELKDVEDVTVQNTE